MNWFERLVGFQEQGYAKAQEMLSIDGDRLVSKVNGGSYGIGTLELVSLQSLRDRVAGSNGGLGKLNVSSIVGDVRQLHSDAQYSGALFQVASQFNLLEMVAPHITPEHGVGRYEGDPTQGPGCAMAAGAATIYRNYFVLVGGVAGQTSQRQINGLSDLGQSFSEMLDMPVESLWAMQNGYALCTRDGLKRIDTLLRDLSPEEINTLAGKLRIGLHWDVEVTDEHSPRGQTVTQAFCSALPVAYSSIEPRLWKRFACLVLQAAYESTLLAAVLNSQRGRSNIALLTRLGGGAFGNDDSWIDQSLVCAQNKVEQYAIDVRRVTYRSK
jgi:hypothetical protein